MLFMFYFSSVITVIQLNHFKMTSKVLYKGNYKQVRKQLRLLQPKSLWGAGSHKGVCEPWRGNSQEGALPGPSSHLPVLLVLVIQAILSEQQNLLHFGYIAFAGSFVDLFEVPVSDAVPGLEAGSTMTSVSPQADGGV